MYEAIENELSFLLPRTDNAHYFRFGGDVAIHSGYTAHLLDLAADTDRRHLEHKRIAWHDRTAKSAVLDAAEKWDAVFTIFKFAKCENCPNLGESLDLQYSGHYGRPREVSGKKMLVDSDLFNP